MPPSDSQTFLRELDKKLWTAAAKLPAGTEINMEKGFSTPLRKPRTYKITSTGKLIDDALEAVEKENPKLKNVPVASVYDRRTSKSRVDRRQPREFRTNRRCAKPRKTSDGRRPTLQLQIDPANLAGLIDLIATIPFQHPKDILGHAPKSSPSNSSSAPLCDLCAFAVQISSPRMATGMSPLPDTFTRDQHPDLRADFVMALPSAAARSLPRSQPADRPNGRINPPFNIKEWWDGKLEGDARWNLSEAELASHFQFYKNRGKYGTPPQTAMRECAPLKSEGIPQVVSEARDKNANFAWVQHMLQNLSGQSAATTDLAPNGSMAPLLANGSMSSNSSSEGDICRALIEADFRARAIKNMVGTNGRQRVPYECFENYLIAVPSPEVAHRFDDVTAPLIAKVKANSNKSRTLAMLRDTLLPALLRSQI